MDQEDIFLKICWVNVEDSVVIRAILHWYTE